ncbi:MAG: ROK family protein, partial [Pseudonocardiaceae bacterium]
MRCGAVELGGTKIVCLIGSNPDHVVARTRIATGEPSRTLAQVIDFFRQAGGPLAAIGVASFGPLELRRSHPRYGRITSTPKVGWAGVDVVGPIRSALGVPVGFDTDVNGAALGEGRWGAARGLDTFVYMTVGTGIGVGAVIEGRVLHGLGHPEMGHISVARQPGDDFPGECRFHADCLEGMAGGTAIAARWGRPAEQLDGDELAEAVALQAAYLAAGLRDIVYTIAPQRIVIGGSVTALPGLSALVRVKLAETMAGYHRLPEHGVDDFIVPAALGPLA